MSVRLASRADSRGAVLHSHIPGAPGSSPYDRLGGGIQGLLFEARRGAARAVNGIRVATDRKIGRRIVPREAGVSARAGGGEALWSRSFAGLTSRLGRGFPRQNLPKTRPISVAFSFRKIRRVPASIYDAKKRVCRWKS